MKLLKSFSIYTIVSFFGAGISFFLMPLLSYYLSPADYGTTSIINTYVSLLSPFIGLLAYGLITVEYYRMRNKDEFVSLFSSVQVIPILPAFVLGVTGMFFYKRIAALLELPADHSWVGIVIILLSLLVVYIETANSYFIISKNARLYAFFTMAKVITESSLTVWLVVILKMGWEGRVLSWAIATVLFSIIAFYIFYRQGLLTRRIQKKYIFSSLAYGIPLIPHDLGKYVINQSDRIFIAKMVSLGEAGIYSVGYTVGMILMILVAAFSNVFTPFLMERLADITDEKKKQIVRLSYQAIGGMLIALLAINLISPLLFSLMISKTYSHGSTYVFWVSLGYFFWGCYLLFSGYIFFYKKTMILFWTAVVNIFSNLLFNYIFIKKFGAIGAAYATALSFFIVFIIVLYQSSRLIKLPWFSSKILHGAKRADEN